MLILMGPKPGLSACIRPFRGVIEVQVAKDFSRAYFIIEADTEVAAKSALEAQNVTIELVKEVRLIGKELEEVKANKEHVNYLVEWEIPAEITMDKYLEQTTGKVVGCMGGLGSDVNAIGINRVFSPRQPGSSIKPIGVYGAGIEKGIITGSTIYDNTYPTVFGGNTQGKGLS